MSLKIGSLEIPYQSGFDIRQSYEDIGAKTLLRTKNGSAILQSRWQKLSSQISGSGWLPDGMDGLDTTVSIAVSCIGTLSKQETDTAITIPRAFRTDGDYAPQGAAFINGELVPTAISLIGSNATLTTVSGATFYAVIYVPIITGFITVSRQFDEAANLSSWTINLIEA